MDLVFIGQNQQSDVRYVISGSTPLVRPNRQHFNIGYEQDINNNHPNIQHGEVSPSLFGLPHH